MSDDKKGKAQGPKDDEKKNPDEQEEKIPICTTATGAEHFRGHDEDEPCDDGRSG